MSAFLLHFKTAWSDHLTVTGPTNFDSQTYVSRQTPSNSYVYFSNCLFKSISSSSQGGALYCTSTTYFLVESTSFFSCKTSSGNQGAIYFDNGNGQSVLHCVCGYDCSASHVFQFAYMIVNNAASSKNNANYTSVSRCVNENSNSNYVLGFTYGKISCTSVNSSMHKCQYRLGIGCWPLQESNTVTCSLSYSTFADNIANGFSCVWLNTYYANYEIKSCNILRNTQVDRSTYGIVYTSGNLMIEDSCILENEATYIFHQECSSYTITLSNCTVDKTTCNRNLKTQNTVTKSFILALNHMSTENCQSEYDSAGYLTPIVQSPSSSKKQIRLCTCGEFLYHFPQGNFFSSTFVLIFNFIHLHSSCDPWQYNI
jgi:hypothetical protein